MPVNPTKAVLFDAAGTLLHVHPSVGEVYAGVASRHGAYVSTHAIARAFRDAWREFRPYADGSTPFHTSESIERAWWRMLVERVFDRCGALALFDGRFDAFFDELYLHFERPDVWRVFPDVAPTLRALRSLEIRCAVVSNWDSRLPRLLHAMGIADRFEFVLTSAEAGISKPSPEIFRTATARLGIEPECVLHVGDSFEDDAVAARNAGLRAVHLVRDKRTRGFEPTVRTLEELPPLLSRY